MGQKVAILGASDKPDRYSFKAFQMLREYGHTPVPVSPKIKNIEGVAVLSSLNDIQEPVETLTMYVGPETSQKLTDEILNLKPQRVIFNPGSENPILAAALKNNGVQVLEACTLVLLKTKQF